ncbi:MAG: DinB family protein [Ignavibacteriaceae bacterium]|nr:DinB family protein [Ignavibacteriaceae bacterium]
MFGLKKHLFIILFLSLTAVSFADQPVIVKEFLGQVDFMRGRVTQLADAMPQSTYEWRPMEGVRSVSEVYLHVAFSNYLCVTITGGTVPEEAGFVMDFSKAHDRDTQTTDKAEIMNKMNQSFDVLKERIAALTEEDLNREVEAFGMKMSVRNFIISMISHCHEHLGQSIAYARMNGVVPPWSKKESEG